MQTVNLSLKPLQKCFSLVMLISACISQDTYRSRPQANKPFDRTMDITYTVLASIALEWSCLAFVTSWYVGHNMPCCTYVLVDPSGWHKVSV